MTPFVLSLMPRSLLSTPHERDRKSKPEKMSKVHNILMTTLVAVSL